MQPDQQQPTERVLKLSQWSRDQTAADASPSSLAICAFTSTERSAPRLAVLHGGQLTVLSVRSVSPSAGAARTAAAAQLSPGSASLGSLGTSEGTSGLDDYADITPDIHAAKGASNLPAKGSKKKHMHGLRVLVACVGPPGVLVDEEG